MAHIPGLGVMFTGFSAQGIKDTTIILPPPPPPPPPPPLPISADALKFVVNSGYAQNFIVPTTGQLNDQYQSCNWIIHWGDGVIETCTDLIGSSGSGIFHTYPSADTEYEIAISPADPDELGWLRAFGFSLNYIGADTSINKDKILRITSGELTKQAVCVNENDNNVCTNMFAGCTKLTSIGDFNLPQDISGVVGDNFCVSMFDGCKSLTSIGEFKLPQGITTVGNAFCANMFESASEIADISNFALPPNIRIAGNNFCNNLFYNNNMLTNLGGFRLSQTLTTVGDNFCKSMFRSCRSLTSIGEFKLPQGITGMGAYFFESTFESCYKLEHIPTSFFGDLQFTVSILDNLRPFNATFKTCSIATGDMAGVPMLQISPRFSGNQCFLSTPNVLNVPANWK